MQLRQCYKCYLGMPMRAIEAIRIDADYSYTYPDVMTFEC